MTNKETASVSQRPGDQPRFLHYGDDVRRHNRILVILNVILVVAVVFLASQVGRSKFIYIDPDKIVGDAKVGYVPPHYVDYFASHFVVTLMTVTPVDALAQYKSAYGLMSSQLASKMKTILESEIEMVKQGNLFVTTVPVRINTTQTGKGAYAVTLWARKASFSFGKLVGEKFIECQLDVRKTAPREMDPYGLEVQSYDFKEVDEATAYNSGNGNAP